MAFFEMAPMGGMNVGGRMAPMGRYGGMNVGGFPVGGALPAKYLTEQARELGLSDNPKWIAMRDKAEAGRARKANYLEALAQQIQAETGANKRDAKAMAKIQLAQDTLRDTQTERAERVPVVRASRKGLPRAPLTALGSFLLPLRDRLTVKHAKKKKFDMSGISAVQLKNLNDALVSMGLGIHDLQTGCGIFDDIMSGVSKGVDIGTKLLPFIM
jgi:hypothetical protein